jgi:transposase
MEETMSQRRRRREFTDAYKAEVVALCQRGDRSIARVARDLDLTETSVRRWVAQAEVDAGHKPGLTSAELAEMARLRRENRVLREERDILKRAVSFFARDDR